MGPGPGRCLEDAVKLQMFTQGLGRNQASDDDDDPKVMRQAPFLHGALLEMPTASEREDSSVRW